MGNDNVATAVMAPGEHRISKEDRGSEVTRPWEQYTRLSVALLILFCSVSATLFVIGYCSLVGAGWLMVILMLVFSQNIEGSGPRAVVTLTVVTVGIFWFLHGRGACEELWIFPTLGWHWMVKSWVVAGISVVISAPAAWVAYRYAVEIVDPGGPTAPRKAMERIGPVFPWTPEPEEETGLDAETIRAMMEEMLKQVPREIVRIEMVKDSDGNGNLHIGAEITANDFPVSREKLQALAEGIRLGRYKFSRRDVASVPGIGDDQARALLEVLVGRGFLEHPNGRNHPEGAALTAKGRALMRGLLS